MPLGDGKEQATGVVADASRAWGAVSTPSALVEWMVSLVEPRKGRLRVLEPACGDCPFLAEFTRRYGSHHELVGIDIVPEAIRRARDRVPSATLIEGDFLLWEPTERFDLILGNPPYGIIGDASHYPIHTLQERKALYKQRFSTWRGKFNLYGAFIEHGVRLLKPEGVLVFVVPASWLVLDDFAKLRAFLAQAGRLRVYYLGKVFPRRNVACGVLVLERGGVGLELYEGHRLALCKSVYRGELIRFETPEWQAFEARGVALGGVFAIHFAARGPEVRAHPEVSETPRAGYVPVLTGRNLKAGWIDYAHCYSGLWLPHNSAPSLRAFYGFPHLVVGHTKGTRVVAAVDDRCYPWREEFHLVPKEEGLNLYAIADYLNSEPVQRYVSALYRDFVPHLTATMLRWLPLDKSLDSLGARSPSGCTGAESVP